MEVEGRAAQRESTAGVFMILLCAPQIGAACVWSRHIHNDIHGHEAACTCVHSVAKHGVSMNIYSDMHVHCSTYFGILPWNRNTHIYGIPCFLCASALQYRIEKATPHTYI